MKILFLTNLFPPHHAGTFDFRCERMANLMKLRGHTVLVLTSSHGLRTEQRDSQVERRLTLNGAFSHPLISKYSDLKNIEIHNHSVLKDVVVNFQPDVIHVFSMLGLSKSLIFGLRNLKLPTVYDVADEWIAPGISQDPWLRFWNAPSLPLMESSSRRALELSGERGRLDSIAPTRMAKGYDRLPMLFGSETEIRQVQPNSIPSFRFDRIYFCSETLKQKTENAGFCVNHAEVIYPGIQAEDFVGEIKAEETPTKLLLVGPVTENSGFLTAVRALKLLRDAKIKATISIYGKGETKYVSDLRSVIVTQQLPVEFLPVATLNKDLPSVYRHHHVLLHTSEWEEPFPITPLEAMASGLPVIGTICGGGAELFRHGENALVFNPGDEIELSSRIQELQIQPALRNQMAETAQGEVLSKYNLSTVTDKIEDYLNTSQEIWAHTAT